MVRVRRPAWLVLRGTGAIVGVEEIHNISKVRPSHDAILHGIVGQTRTCGSQEVCTAGDRPALPAVSSFWTDVEHLNASVLSSGRSHYDEQLPLRVDHCIHVIIDAIRIGRY